MRTACPLDCPDACSLDVHVENGKIVSIEGNELNPSTSRFICAKVRDFTGRVYGPLRVSYPRVRTGPKGHGVFKRTTWDEALSRVAEVITDVKRRWGGEAILPFYYGGSNGFVTQDLADAELFRGLGTSRIARTLCAAPTGAAAQAMYGKMPGVAYEDYIEARLIVVWGANPSVSGIHLVPFIKAARARGATLVVVDPRATSLARLADLHLPVRPGTDLPLALAIHGYLFEHGLADRAFLAQHTSGAEQLEASAAEWPMDRAAAICGVPAEHIERFARLYAESSPAVIRCGWGLERNRNGGNAVLAVLALPAVAGKFGLRGGGYTMSNSAAWGLGSSLWVRTPEPNTRLVNMNQLGRALTTLDDPPVKVLFVYNCNPAVTVPDQNRILRGLLREDLFTIVFDQVMTDTAQFADLVLPATTFLEHYDIARGYGAYSLQLVKPAIDAVGESRTNVEVFGELAQRLGLTPQAELENDAEALLRVVAAMPEPIGAPLLADGMPVPPSGPRPVQFVDVFPRTDDQKAHLHPSEVVAAGAPGLYTYRPDPATPQFPLALISPATEKTVSSTFGELRQRPATLYMHPDDAAARGIAEGDTVRVYNELGEVQCPVTIGELIAAGTVTLPKGLWRRSTLNESTATALAPDSLSDLGGGACFNDARVEVALVLSAQLRDQSLSIWVAPANTGRPVS